MVSEDGKKVRRQHPLTESDMEELQVGVIYCFTYSMFACDIDLFVGSCICLTPSIVPCS